MSEPASAQVRVYYNNGGIVVGVEKKNAQGEWENVGEQAGPPGQEKWPNRPIGRMIPTYFVFEAFEAGVSGYSPGQSVDPCIQQGNKLYCW
jgi:hypothetical protein